MRELLPSLRASLGKQTALLGWALLGAALAGCAGYELGPTNGMAAGAKSVAIRPFVNKTHEPRLTEYLAMSLRRELQVDGTFHLQTSGSPDILLTGEITRFQRSGLSYNTNDILTPQEYVLGLDAHVVARDTGTGRVIFDRLIRGSTYLSIGNDLGSSERQAIPILTDTLARTAIAQLADGNW
jgi:hypothetical protein